ncbi:hypothetical protein [Mesomycoplasma ovipneumoniae]|uniref:hypothetical protein n=1 Tax=Mesomycoplasma ovipneumoniae TaxID=29562 RepID=UPI00311AE0F2
MNQWEFITFWVKIIQSPTHTHTHTESSNQTPEQTSTITFIKPKFIVERTVGVPWSTSQVVFAAKKNLNDPTKRWSI